jgi:hypothetical protein
MRRVTQSADADRLPEAVGAVMFLIGTIGVLVSAPAHLRAALVCSGLVEVIGLRVWLKALLSAGTKSAARVPRAIDVAGPEDEAEELMPAA